MKLFTTPLLIVISISFLTGCLSDNSDSYELTQDTDAEKLILENTIALCSDSIDNDNDGLIDCRDRECAAVCLPELVCNDGLDDDNDGNADCFDVDCAYNEHCRELFCRDGFDNDGDGVSDCEDSDCREECIPEFNCLDGQDNDKNGLTDCEDENCRHTEACKNFTRENTHSLCSNNLDDDGDLKIDCDDPECAQFIHCVVDTAIEQTAITCSNRVDDDNDGFVDCEDLECEVFSVCSTDPASEASYARCIDGIDNDGDGKTDCADGDCAKTEACLPEVNCHDGIDNDLDSLKDCDDMDCVHDSRCAVAETNCIDGFDNDGDSYADCLDRDCYDDLACEVVLEQPITSGDSTIVDGSSYWPSVAGETGTHGLTIINNCFYDLWSHAVAFDQSGGTRVGDGGAIKIPSKKVLHFGSVPDFGGGRVYAYYKDPGDVKSFGAPLSEYNQFVEMTFNDGLNYNISYVDYISLPVSVRGNDGRCPETKCSEFSLDFERVLKERCPTIYEYQHSINGHDLGRCMSSWLYCNDPVRNNADEYCTKMEVYSGMYDSQVLSGFEVYAGFFPERSSADVAFWDQISAWNRGSESGESSIYEHYLESRKPFNEYARMIHKDLGCKAYAYSTDDHQSQGGFERCTESEDLTITWCPDD